MNRLFMKLTQVLRKNYGPQAGLKPLALGRIYSCIYGNWHHDPKPLLLVLGSDAFYTVGINIHYLGGYESYLTRFIMLMRQSQMVLNGLMIYRVLKLRYPKVIVKRAFRKYFTAQLHGKLVSAGISTAQEMNVMQFLKEPFIKKLDNLLHPKLFSFKRPPSFSPRTLTTVRSQIIQTAYNAEKSRPFANRGVSYYPEGEGPGAQGGNAQSGTPQTGPAQGNRT